MTTGTMLLVWLGEQITERGIGNGVSLIITIGIVARLPFALQALKDMFFPGNGIEAQYKIFGTGTLLVVLLVVVIGGVIAITQAQRKIPVQYAQRAVGRKMYAGGTSFMPLRVNYSGVMPIIFAQSILMFPGTIFQWLSSHQPAVFARPFAMVRRAIRLWLGALSGRVCADDSVLFLFLGGDAVQRNPDRRRLEEKRRLHSRRASGAGHERLSAQGDEPHHAGGCDFPDRHRDDTDHFV